MKRRTPDGEGALRQAVESLERRMIIAALISAKGRMNSAADSLGISIRIMGLRVRKYGIDLKAYKRLMARMTREEPTPAAARPDSGLL